MKYVSPELYLGTQIGVFSPGDTEPRETLGLVRGVTQTALLVRNQLETQSLPNEFACRLWTAVDRTSFTNRFDDDWQVADRDLLSQQ